MVVSRVGLVIMSGVVIVVVVVMAVVVMAVVVMAVVVMAVVVMAVVVMVVAGVGVVVMIVMPAVVMSGVVVVVVAGMSGVVVSFMLAVVSVRRCHVGTSSIERYASEFVDTQLLGLAVEPGPGFQVAKVMVFKAFRRRFFELERQMADAMLFVNKTAHIR